MITSKSHEMKFDRILWACSDAESEVLNALGVPFSGLGYGIWAPEFTSLRKEKEFLEWRASEHPEWVDNTESP